MNKSCKDFDNDKENKSQQIEDLQPIELIKKFQQNSQNIRNICVLAHVDHGKTSLVDSLISYNNIINPKLAGDVRYMDSRPDEQERCITMKSSSISITYNSELHGGNFLINLIDSPGHVDFSSEIFSALKICDGAIIMIDVVEGICSQTEFVIKQAWDEKIKCVLVINKIDRLISEIQLDPLEAYHHLNNLLEKANSLMGSLIVRDINIKNDNETYENRTDEEVDIDKLIEEKENELYFSPAKGNVIFTSALDNWGFTLESFAEILSKRIGFKKEAVLKALWGNFFFNSKKKKIYKDAELANNSKPMFVEFILENIYKLYKMILIEKNLEKIQKAASSINAVITTKELNGDKRNLLKTIFRQWLPIPPTVFDVAIKQLPNPITGLSNKIDVLFPPYKVSQDFELISKLKEFIASASASRGSIETIKTNNFTEPPCLAFISKMVALPRKNISGENFEFTNSLEQKDEVKFMAFARNYCGTFKKGHEYFVIGPKHDPKSNNYDIKKFKFDNLYFFMGQYLEEIKEVPSGNIFSIGGLENYVYKTATITDVFNSPPIVPSNLNKNSIIKVSILTDDIKDMPKLVDGLKKLYRSDPAVDYYVQSNGEHILVTAGEVHLERCIKDLEDQLAKVKVKTSLPIVNFKEGLANKNYQFRLKKDIETKKHRENIVKEKKRDLNLFYVLDVKNDNIDIDDEEEILKSCTPMVLTKKVQKKKPEEKVDEFKVKDIKSIKEKTNFFIEKNMRNTTNEKAVTKTIKAYAEDTTPNKLCKIAVSSIGMSKELIEFLEKNENLIKEIENRDFIVCEDLFNQFQEFNKNLIDLIENKRLKSLVENNLFCFGPNTCIQNMLIIKNISNDFSYFHRVRKPSPLESELKNENPNTFSHLDTNISSSNDKIDEVSQESAGDRSSQISTSQKISFSNKDDKLIKSKKKNNLIVSNSEKESSYLEEELSNKLKDNVTPKEFLNSIKSGFDLAVLNGPLCEESIYGVIFIIEEIIVTKSEETKDNKEINNITCNTIQNDTNDVKNIDTNMPTTDTLCDNLKNISESKDASLENSSKNQNYSIYGPFMGQIIGTVKDCCRKAFLNGEPRLYEAIYLCHFQIRQEHVGKIHSVVSRRRGTIINEFSNDESIICTIEAVVPVIESFGFVEEIRKNTSGMANPMLKFHKWEIIDIDPFYIPIDQETLENFGANIDSPNLAKIYINKIRMRKGLPIDEKLVKNAEKQSNLSNKR